MVRQLLGMAALGAALSLSIPSGAGAQATILPCGGTETLLNPLFAPLDTTTLALDDGSFAVPLAPAFPAGLRFAGTTYTEMYVNVNGNVTFGSAFGEYTPAAIPGLDQPTVAPFFADVDLRARGTDANPGTVHYCMEPGRVMVTWRDTVHYDATLGSTSFARRNTFQMILTPALVCGTDGAIVEFRYGELVWHAGTFSGAGSDGLCTEATVADGTCTPAVAGIDYGDTITAVQLPGSLTVPVNSTLLTTSNVGTPGVWRVEINPSVIPSCGNEVDDGACEDCDDGGETASCDRDCTFVTCGDGVHNASAGEVCDTGGDTLSCDDDCTLVMCGDGNANTAAGEACDTGGASASCDADCTLATCGDLTVNTAAGETCDAGSETASCDADCTAVECGDGERNTSAGEECDDGNTVAGDGCSNTCALEACGNGRVDSGEECDDSGESASCDADCSAAMCGDGVVNASAGEACDEGESASCDPDCSAAMCGDGLMNATAGEACDDGNTTAGDGCNATCQVEACGNAVVDAGEDCDEGEQTAACDGDCTAPACGDGLINTLAGESCDDGNTDDGDGCNALCVSEACGNAVVDRGEECDDGAASASCDADCTDAVCGDGLPNEMAGESCDDAGASASCDDDCSAVECGDGNVNAEAGEACDDGNTDGGDGCSASCEIEQAPDAGVDGGNVVVDAGPDTETYGVAGGACGCRAVGVSSDAPWMLALVALALVWRRRR